MLDALVIFLLVCTPILLKELSHLKRVLSLFKDHNLPPVVFHSLGYSSVTYKLKLNGGDVKAVQGESGHAQISMVTDVYCHILDDERKKNAELFEYIFYISNRENLAMVEI